MRRRITDAEVQHVNPHGKLFSLGSPRNYKTFVGRKKKFLFLEVVRYSSMILLTAHGKRDSEIAAKIYVKKRLNIHHTLKVWNPVIFMFLALKEYLSGHRFTCDEDVKRATITWLSQQRNIYCASGMDR